jgi:hypothetical protein
MSLSTSLDDLLGPQPGMEQQQQNTQQTPQMDNNQFVDAILTELEDMPNYENNQNAARQQYAMNPDAHIPPPQLGNTENLLRSQESRDTSTINLTDKFSNDSSKGFLKKYKKELISCAIFMILMFILSLHQVNRIIFGFMPKLILENGQISIMGILLKTLIATLIFAVVIFLI